MRSNHPLQGAFDRIDRGEEHLAELELEIIAFGQRYHDAVTVHYNLETLENRRHHHLDITPPPESLSHPRTRVAILTGEVIYNLRAALDYLIYELAILDSGAVQNGTQFPICGTKQRFDGTVDKVLAGLNSTHKGAIERLQPYNGCKWTAILQGMSNPDKHRKLIANVSAGRIAASPAFAGTFAKAHTVSIESIRQTQGPGGEKMDVHLQTVALIQIPVKDPASAVGETNKLVAEVLEELKTSVRRTLSDFQSEF